jgi:hypothetical protein
MDIDMDADIDQLLTTQSHQSQAAALHRLLRNGYFGNMRPVNGSVIWHILNQYTRLPPAETSYAQLDDIRGRMKAAPVGDEGNKAFLNELINMNHFGDLRRVPHTDMWKKHLGELGLQNKYDNWYGHVSCAVCKTPATLKCPESGTMFCSETCYETIAGKDGDAKRKKNDDDEDDEDDDDDDAEFRAKFRYAYAQFNCRNVQTFIVSASTWMAMPYFVDLLKATGDELVDQESGNIYFPILDHNPETFNGVLDVIKYSAPPPPSGSTKVVAALNEFRVPQFGKRTRKVIYTTNDYSGTIHGPSYGRFFTEFPNSTEGQTASRLKGDSAPDNKVTLQLTWLLNQPSAELLSASHSGQSSVWTVSVEEIVD